MRINKIIPPPPPDPSPWPGGGGGETGLSINAYSRIELTINNIQSL